METGAGRDGAPGVGAPGGGASVSFAPGDPSSKLLELERTLAAKDAVMEPGVMDSLRTYVASGGKPEAAIELLSENYRGYAQMSSLVCGWLELTEETEPSAHKHAGRAAEFSPLSPVAQLKDRGGDASAAATPRYYGDEDDTPQGGTTAPRVEATPPGSGFAAGGGAGAAVAEALEGWRGRVRRDETFFLEQLIRKKFDPRLVDAVKGRPTWLTQLLHSDRGRGVLFSLAEKHPDCLLITVAIQHAWQHGHADEVKALGPAAASYFSIFHELLADHFRDLIGAGDDEARLAEATGAIRTACCQSLATYLFAQMMLADLANGGDAGLGGDTSRATQSSAFATRVSQELRAAAAEAHGAGVVRRVAPLLAASDADARAATVVGDLLQAADDFKKRKNTSSHALAETTRKLRAMYLDDLTDDASQRVENFEKPSTAPIRAPELLRALLDEAFRWDPNADPKRNAENRARCFDLIAFATCGEDEVSETREKLSAVFEWCAGTTRGVALCLEEGSSPFLETITHPVPAAGALAWVKSAMGNPEHYKQVHAAANTAAYLHVVSEICKAHVRLRLEALETVTAAIAAMGKGANEQTHLATLDVAVELVEHGLVLPALRAATDKWRRDVDPSHLRYFAGEVLEVAGPPYSGAFAAAALELLRAANAGKGMTRACDEFVEQCRRQRARGALQPPLSKDLDEVLDRLAGSGAKGR
jgi:negative elongation factor C/D